MEDSVMNYTEAVKVLRNKMIMSKMKFTDNLGASFGTVNRWENNRVTPTIKAKRKLAPLFKKYGIEVDE